MSSKIAEYKFADYSSWQSAKNRLYEKLGDVYTDAAYDVYCYITIWDNCDDPKLAGQICQANGGEAV